MNKKIISTLSPLNIPVAFMEYSGGAKAYILFHVYNETDGDYADNENESEIYYIAINYYYRNPKDKDKAKQIKDLMKKQGFIFDGGGGDLKDGQFYGKNYDFIYKEFLD